MLLCIPTRTAEGLDARVDAHFGRAHHFTFIDPVDEKIDSYENSARDSGGGGRAVTELLGRAVDAVVCREVGAGAHRRLHDAGIAIYRSGAAKTVSDVLAAFTAGKLQELTASEVSSHSRSHQAEGQAHVGQGQGLGRGHGRGTGQGRCCGRGEGHHHRHRNVVGKSQG